MKRSEKSDGEIRAACANLVASGRRATITHSPHPILPDVVEVSYTTPRFSPGPLVRYRLQPNAMAFVRRKGNAYYLVHNVRRGGKVRQLHLARLGERARITDAVVKQVSKKHPFIDLNWRSLREQLDNQIDLADPESPAVEKLIATLRAVNLELADLFPPFLRISQSPVVARELLVQLRLLQSTLQVKLEQLGQGARRFGETPRLRHGR